MDLKKKKILTFLANMNIPNIQIKTYDLILAVTRHLIRYKNLVKFV